MSLETPLSGQAPLPASVAETTSQPTQVVPQPQPQPTEHGVRLLGVGNAGLKFVQQVISSGVPATVCGVMNSDLGSLHGSAASLKLYCTPPSLAEVSEEEKADLLRGSPESRVRALGRAAGKHVAAIKSFCEGNRVVLILVGFGGAAGTGITPVLARAAKETGAQVIALVSLPFNCEGNLRPAMAQAGLEELRSVADLVICFPNQKVLTTLGDATPLVDAYKAADAIIVGAARAAWKALVGTPVMGLPLSDLCLIIRERSPHCVFAVAEASGPNRGVEAVENLLANPFLGGIAGLAEAQALGVLIIGNSSLGIAEVNRIMERVGQECDGIPIVMGAAINSALSEQIQVGMFLAGPDPDQAAEPVKLSPAHGIGPAPDLGSQLIHTAVGPRRPSRFVPPPPEMTQEKARQLRGRQTDRTGRGHKGLRLRQTQLPLEIVSKGRFDKSLPTIHKGEDLDVPTYIRRGVQLN